MPTSAPASRTAPSFPPGSLTVGLIKSEAIRNGHVDAIVSLLLKEVTRKFDDGQADKSAASLAIIPLKLTREQATAFYSDHIGKPYFEGLIESVTGDSGVVAILLSGDNVIERWRKLMGPTDPVVARQIAPDTIRALYATAMPHTAVHGAGTDEEAARQFAVLQEIPEMAHFIKQP